MRDYFLKTDRIGFSVWTEKDVELAKSLWGDSNVSKFITATGEFTDQEITDRLKKEIKNYNNYSVQYYPIFDLSTNDFLGCCGLRPYKLEEKIYEIGIHLMSNAWGKGYAIEATKAIIKYGFDSLHIDNIFAGHNPNNVNSKKLLEKLGFHYIGDEFYEPTGLYHPSYLYRKNN